MERTWNMVRIFLSDRNSVRGSRSKKPEKQQIESIKDIYSLKHLQAFLEALFMSSSWALSLCSINRCCSYIRSRCPFQSAQICSKFLLLSFRIPSIFTRFLSRAEPPRETCWSWLSNKYLQIIHKGKNIKKGQTLVSSQPASQPASQHSQPLGRSVGQIMAVTR